MVLRDFDVDEFGVARAPAAQFMAYGAGIVWIVESLLAIMIRRPEATPAGIPVGDPRIGPGSKCNAVHAQLMSENTLKFSKPLSMHRRMTSGRY